MTTLIAILILFNTNYYEANLSLSDNVTMLSYAIQEHACNQGDITACDSICKTQTEWLSDDDIIKRIPNCKHSM